MTIDASAPDVPTKSRRFDRLHVSLFVLLAIIVSAIVTVWLVRVYIFPKEFSPVTLNQKEQQVLNKKIDRLSWFGSSNKLPTDSTESKHALEPEAYSEVGAKREIVFSEKELNAMLAKNTDLAHKLAIDLSDDLVSAKLLVPMDEDFPVLGGKTLKVRAGLELAYNNAKPIVILKGISVMGVPLPNAWIGGLKNIDLVTEFGNEAGFWKSFGDGVEFMQVKDGSLLIKLKE